MVSSVRLCALVVLLALSLSGVAAADKAVAADAYKRGMAAYALDDWDAAIAQFERGFREEPRPEFLFNIAQSHRQAGRHEQAIRFYQRYLDLKPGAADRPEVERVIATLRASVAAKQRANAATPVGIEGARVTPGDPVEPVPPPRSSDAPRRDGLAIGLITAGAVVAVAGAGVAVFGALSDAKAHDGSTRIDLGERQQLLSSGNSMKVAGYVAIGVGVAALTAGIVKLAMRPRSTMTMGVGFAPSQVAIALQGSF